MNAIWFLSKEKNLLISGFNRVEKNGTSELWVTEMNGNSRKVATGKQAIDIENTLLDIVWQNAPAIITDGSDSFGTNVNIRKNNTQEGAE